MRRCSRVAASFAGLLHTSADLFEVERRVHLGVQRALGDHRVEPVRNAGVDDAVELGLAFGLVTVTNRLDQQLAKRLLLEGIRVAEDVEEVAVVGDRHLINFRQQPREHVPFAGVFRDHVPQVAHLALADAVDTPEALLNAVRVPRQVVIDHEVAHAAG